LEQEIFKSHFFKLFSKYHVSSNYVFYKHLIITQIVHSYFADCLKENLKNSELEKSEKAGLMNYCFWISITIIMQSPFILQILCTRYLPKTTIPTFPYCLKFPYSDIFHSHKIIQIILSTYLFLEIMQSEASHGFQGMEYRKIKNVIDIIDLSSKCRFCCKTICVTMSLYYTLSHPQCFKL
jgi:hypothetical protein